MSVFCFVDNGLGAWLAIITGVIFRFLWLFLTRFGFVFILSSVLVIIRVVLAFPSAVIGLFLCGNLNVPFVILLDFLLVWSSAGLACN